MKLKLDQKVGFRNKHHLIVTDARTGKVKQEAWAHNIILDQGLLRIINSYMIGSYTSIDARRFFGAGNTGNVAGETFLGSGEGIPTPDGSELFNYLGRLNNNYYDSGDLEGVNGAYHTRFVTFDENFHPNTNITEVGLGWDTTNGLFSHALIEDSEGNQIYVTKGEWDIITVYSTVYVEVATSYSNGFTVDLGGAERNFWVSMIRDNPVPRRWNAYYIGFGRDNTPISQEDPYLKDPVEVWNPRWDGRPVDEENKKVITEHRFASTEANDALWEFGAYHEKFGGGLGSSPFFRCVFPAAGIWTGKTIEGEPVGEGDGSQDQFETQWAPIIEDSDTIYVDGVEQTKDTDYTIDNSTGGITFTTPPLDGEPITVNYSVEFIPKDENHVLDIYFTIQFADAGA